MSKLTLHNVTKRYGHHNIINAISLEIPAGEMTVIVGPSGCGKSTLLRMIAGLEDVTCGEIQINDQSVTHVEPKNRNVAMVFQNYALYPHMSVFQNMAYGLKMRGFKKPVITERVNKVAQRLGLTHVLDRRPKELSGGQRQRVAMGRAMVREPAIFLFDEPLSNLDTQLRAQMRLEIKQLQQQLKTTSIYVTHDQVEAMTLADRLVVMNHGIIEQIGTPIEIYHQPATKFVAQFIGSPAMNFFMAQVGQDPEFIILPGGIQLKHNYAPLAQYKNQKIYMGVRPEHYSLSENSDNYSLPMTIKQFEVLGSDTLIHCHMQDEEVPHILRMPGNWQGNLHQKIHVQLAAQNFHFFDTQNHIRI